MTGREAKEFLAAQIVAEAERRNTPLDDVEKKMLYFSESAWMPDGVWEANAEFDRSYDEDAYERKIASLIRDARERDSANDQQWAEAIDTLVQEDHYLSVMISYDSFGPAPSKPRPPHDFLKLIATAILVIALSYAAMFMYSNLTGR